MILDGRICLTSSIICSARDLVYHQTYATTINHMKSWLRNKKSTYRVSFEKPNSSSSRRSIFTPYFPTYYTLTGCPFPCLFKHKITTTDRFVNIAVCHKNQWLVSTSFFYKGFSSILYCYNTNTFRLIATIELLVVWSECTHFFQGSLYPTYQQGSLGACPSLPRFACKSQILLSRP